MKHQINAVPLLAILFLGLTSCGSDNQPVLSPPPEAQDTKNHQEEIPLELVAWNPDTTTEDYKEIKHLHIESRLHLTAKVHSKSVPEDAKVVSLCQLANSEKIYQKELTLKNLSQIPVARLLPLEILTASSESLKTSPLCEISMELLSSKTQKVMVDLVELHINGIADFSNFQPFPHVQLSPKQEFGYNELSTWQLKTFPNRDQISLACDGKVVGETSTLGGDAWPVLLAKVPKTLTRQECRVLGVTSLESGGIWLSPSFYINGDPANLKIVQHHYSKPEGKAANGWYPSPISGYVVVYELKNESAFPAVLKIQIPSSKMSIQMLHKGLHFSGTNGVNGELAVLKGPTKTTPIQWNMKSQTLTLPPGKSFKIKGTVNQFGIRCVHIPGGSTYGTGINYSNLPIVQQNRFSNGRNPVWSTVLNDNVSGVLKQNSYQSYSFWVSKNSPINGQWEEPKGTFGENQCW